MSDEEIIKKVGDLFSKQEQDSKLYALAKMHGLDIKNNVELTEDTKDNLAVTIVSLLLAKRENDANYNELVRVGIQRKSLRSAIVNSYKDKALDLIKTYKSGQKALIV
jgi:hypothetical protein